MRFLQNILQVGTRFSRQLVIVCAVCVALTNWVTPASATAITYTDSGVASGTIGGTTFTNALVTVTLVADTTHVTTVAFCVPAADTGGVLTPCLFNPGSATVTISGVGTATVTDMSGIYQVATGGVGAVLLSTVDLPPSLTSQTTILGTVDPSLATYGLQTSIGPITATFPAGPADPFATHDTTLGVLSFTANATTTTFTATTPEPASLVLLASGLAAFGSIGLVRRWRGYPMSVARPKKAFVL